MSQRCSLLLLQNRGCRPRDFLDERTSGRPRSPFREACPALRLAAGALGGPSAQRRLYAPGALVGRARAVRQGYEGARAKYTVLLDVALLQGQNWRGKMLKAHASEGTEKGSLKAVALAACRASIARVAAARH